MASPKTHIEALLQERLAPYWGHPLSQFMTEKKKGHKGWAGHCLEALLGASEKNSPGVDFPQWGVELKTLPLSEHFQVVENTFLSKVTLPFHEGGFQSSQLYQKMRCIFWVPLIAPKGAPLEQRVIGKGFLWEMSPKERDIFEQDWDELTFFIRQGQFSDLCAHLGTALHIRPKAANSRDKVRIQTPDGGSSLIVPIGFYLRRSFTQELINNRFLL